MIGLTFTFMTSEEIGLKVTNVVIIGRQELEIFESRSASEVQSIGKISKKCRLRCRILIDISTPILGFIPREEINKNTKPQHDCTIVMSNGI